MKKRAMQIGVLATAAGVLGFVATRPGLEGDARDGLGAAPRDASAIPHNRDVAPNEGSERAETPAARSVDERQDWLERYATATDALALSRELADAAAIGDARAQYVLGRVLLDCEIFKRVLARYEQPSFAARVEAHIEAVPNGFERSRRSFRAGAARCERLFSERPFAGRELPEEADGYRYWSDRALASGDPLAVMDRVVRSVAGRGATDGAAKDPAFAATLLRDVRPVVFSGDAAALFAVGGVFSHPSVVSEPTAGLAWQVAACELGYDCSKANPAVGFGCAEDGTCEAGETLLDVMQRDLGGVKYAAIYANAQDIQYKIRTNDWDGLQQYLQVKE